MSEFVQRGLNSKYPNKIKTWRFGEKVPEWISDIAKVIFIDAEGNITLDHRETNTGGLEFLDSSGNRILFTIKSKEDYVCTGDGKLFVLRPLQLELLYKENK